MPNKILNERIGSAPLMIDLFERVLENSLEVKTNNGQKNIPPLSLDRIFDLIEKYKNPSEGNSEYFIQSRYKCYLYSESFLFQLNLPSVNYSKETDLEKEVEKMSNHYARLVLDSIKASYNKGEEIPFEELIHRHEFVLNNLERNPEFNFLKNWLEQLINKSKK
ncbi:hypothetical protein GW932_01400 [archaeon]|nr:hypothetical protein [archaeon]